MQSRPDQRSGRDCFIVLYQLNNKMELYFGILILNYAHDENKKSNRKLRGVLKIPQTSFIARAFRQKQSRL
jgi:hypothetical protein